jgi:TBC1 domain family member 2
VVLFGSQVMDSLIQRAKEHFAKITHKKSDEALPCEVVDELKPGKKKKDHTIFVHPLLDSEFDDVITPPKSPQSKVLVEAGDILREILVLDPVDIKRLRNVCWGGATHDTRHDAWSILTGYYTVQHRPRTELLRRKRQEYSSFLRIHQSVNWDSLLKDRTSVLCSSDLVVGAEEIGMMKQIRKDVPRSSGGVAFLQSGRVKLSLERVLFTWALRHPACGYVQGMNDLVLPFLLVTFAAHLLASRNPCELAELRSEEVEDLLSEEKFSPSSWMDVEGDLYWMCSALLNGLQENFTYNQAGVHALVRKLEAVVGASDPSLLLHLQSIGISFGQFAFRWMNCLLVREFGLRQVLRLFDTYLAEESGNIGKLHVFICASLLTRWSSTLTGIHDFGQAMSFLQNPPTSAYSDRDMDELISEGFLKQQLYENSNTVRMFR